MRFTTSRIDTRETPRAAPLAYRSGDRCPGCGRRNWDIRRTTAECGFCATVLPLAEAAQP